MEERYKYDLSDEQYEYMPDPLYELFLEAAKKKGCIMSGGRIDEERFARLLLDDLQAGRIGRISLERPRI